MCVPGPVSLRELLELVRPTAAAQYVCVPDVRPPVEAPHRAIPQAPWPYTEGLTIAEAANELAFWRPACTGHPLLKQHGAPIRLVCPGNTVSRASSRSCGSRSPTTQPATFWNIAGRA